MTSFLKKLFIQSRQRLVTDADTERQGYLQGLAGPLGFGLAAVRDIPRYTRTEEQFEMRRYLISHADASTHRPLQSGEAKANRPAELSLSVDVVKLV